METAEALSRIGGQAQARHEVLNGPRIGPRPRIVLQRPPAPGPLLHGVEPQRMRQGEARSMLDEPEGIEQVQEHGRPIALAIGDGDQRIQEVIHDLEKFSHLPMNP